MLEPIEQRKLFNEYRQIEFRSVFAYNVNNLIHFPMQWE